MTTEIGENGVTVVRVAFHIREMLKHNLSAREALTIYEIENSPTNLSGDIMRAIGLNCRNSYHADIRKLEKRDIIMRTKLYGERGNTHQINLTAHGYDILSDLLHGGV